MSKVYDIAFKIAGKLSGDFARTFKKGQETVARMGDSLATLNAKAAKMDGLVKCDQGAVRPDGLRIQQGESRP